MKAKKWLKEEKTDEEHYKEFHDKCDNRKTVVLAVNEENKVFGGYNDINWLGAGNVSTNMVAKKRSFLFYSMRDLLSIDEMMVDNTEQLFEIKHCVGDYEIF